MSDWDSLPEEMRQEILGYLDLGSLASMSETDWASYASARGLAGDPLTVGRLRAEAEAAAAAAAAAGQQAAQGFMPDDVLADNPAYQRAMAQEDEPGGGDDAEWQ